jgi:hypothetical protein
MRRALIAAASAVLALAASAAAAAGPSRAPDPDYAQDSGWLCRGANQTLCTTGLDAMRVSADGTRTPETFTPAADPKIDCFYVYPTVSREPDTFADMTPSPEVQETLRGQAARLTSLCRMYAPIYRQLTLKGLVEAVNSTVPANWDGPYRDVRAAWRQYLAHDNHGRGVVLIGHSQGAILLQRLLAEEIDGKPAQKLLVSAFLAGDPEIAVDRGQAAGGSFRHIPLCASAGQTGCVYSWASYLADDASTPRHFGRDPGKGLVTACVNPASPAGGSATLDAYLPKPRIAPADDPPWVHAVGLLAGQCVKDPGGDVLSISVLPTQWASLLQTGLPKYELGPGWGLHRLDLSLPQGDILRLVDAQSRGWAAGGP